MSYSLFRVFFTGHLGYGSSNIWSPYVVAKSPNEAVLIANENIPKNYGFVSDKILLKIEQIASATIPHIDLLLLGDLLPNAKMEVIKKEIK